MSIRLTLRVWAARRALRRRGRRRSWRLTNAHQFYLEVLWQGLLVGGVTYYLPVFLVRLGATPFQMSLYAALPALAIFLLAIPAGAFVERRTNLIRLTGAFRLLNVSSYLAIALLPLILVGDLSPLVTWVALVLWGLTGIGLAFTPPAWTSVYAEAIPADQRPAINGHRFALFNLATAAGVAGFGILLDRIIFPANYQSVFVLSFVAGAMSVYHLSRVRLAPGAFARARTPRPGLGQQVKSLAEMFKGNPQFSRYTVGVFFFRLALAVPSALFTIFWVRELGASDAWLGLRSTAGYAVQMLAFFLLGKAATKWGFQKVLLWSATGLAAYPVLTAAGPTVEWLIPAAIVGSFFTAGIDVTLFEGLLATSSVEKRPSCVAINNAATNAAAFIGPFVGTALAEVIGIRSTLFLAAGITLAASSLFYLLRERSAETGKSPARAIKVLPKSVAALARAKADGGQGRTHGPTAPA